MNVNIPSYAHVYSGSHFDDWEPEPPAPKRLIIVEDDEQNPNPFQDPNPLPPAAEEPFQCCDACQEDLGKTVLEASPKMLFIATAGVMIFFRWANLTTISALGLEALALFVANFVQVAIRRCDNINQACIPLREACPNTGRERYAAYAAINLIAAAAILYVVALNQQGSNLYLQYGITGGAGALLGTVPLNNSRNDNALAAAAAPAYADDIFNA